ncbi:hypothetical protein GALMADRAFT_230630 [Galerina marginata CBS 339.88]|uniref:Uncharacterized protein n=1 Tax=Galerina marginata (strain CBS 339.88) TaxID=685588 RepID=A0A067SEL6_GALM3|nr:hypothetical protein GALMADRAFT_230630 [Galerina marginata CBS 339.88]
MATYRPGSYSSLKILIPYADLVKQHDMSKLPKMKHSSRLIAKDTGWLQFCFNVKSNHRSQPEDALSWRRLTRTLLLLQKYPTPDYISRLSTTPNQRNSRTLVRRDVQPRQP